MLTARPPMSLTKSENMVSCKISLNWSLQTFATNNGHFVLLYSHIPALKKMQFSNSIGETRLPRGPFDALNLTHTAVMNMEM